MTELDSALTYARNMAADPNIPGGERDLWTQIADEIDTYLHDTADHEQGALL
jgi:hypothetical protein